MFALTICLTFSVPDLRLGELELLGELHALGDGEVLVALELGLERLDLRRRERGARTLLAVVAGPRRVVATCNQD